MKAKQKTKENKQNVLPPVFTVANRYKALFDGDKEVKIEVEQKDNTISILVANSLKAACIDKIVDRISDPSITIKVINLNYDRDVSDLLKYSFEGNPHFSRIIKCEPIEGTEVYSTVFKKEVIQFSNDNGGAIEGKETRVMEQLARELLHPGKMTFCTELK